MPYLSLRSHDAGLMTIFGREFRFNRPDFAHTIDGLRGEGLFISVWDDSNNNAFLFVPLGIVMRMMSGWSRVDEETVVRFAEQNRQAIGKLVIDVNTPQFFGGQVDFSAEDCFEVEKLPDGRIVHVYRIPNERFGQA